jgi:hypothetical protein
MQFNYLTIITIALSAISTVDAIACGNQGQIGRNKYDPNCLPANSKGWKSAHNCKGKSYLCVLSGQATCYVSKFIIELEMRWEERMLMGSDIQSIRDAQKRGFEGGECFL